MQRTRGHARLLTITTLTCVGLWSSTAFATTFTVNHTGDAARANGVPVCVCEDTSGPNNCSLRAAVQTANACAGADIIDLGGVAPGSLFTLTIPGAGEDLSATGDLDVTEEVAITGSSHQIDGDTLDRVLDVHPSAPTTLTQLSVINGESPAGAGEAGGCIRARESDLALQNVRVQYCATTLTGGGVHIENARLEVAGEGIYESSADVVGGGIYAQDSDLVIDQVKIRDNFAQLSGGGVLVARSASTVPVTFTISGGQFFDNVAATVDGGALWSNLEGAIDGSSFTNNAAAEDGGAVFLHAWSNVELTRSDLNLNLAARGGGLWQDGGDLLVSEARVFENEATHGAGMGLTGSTRVEYSSIWGNAASGTGGGALCHDSGCELDARNTTVSGNTANNGGGLAFSAQSVGALNNVTLAQGQANVRGGNLLMANLASVSVSNSIFAEGTAPDGPDCFGPLSLDDSLLENPTLCMWAGSNVITWTGAGLGSFGLYGSTESYPLLSTSPAIDVANSATAETDDQAMVPRGPDPDMGACEY